jgi:hypothetical protein
MSSLIDFDDEKDEIKKIPKIIFFFIGGITASEMRIIKLMEENQYKNKYIFIAGTTNFLSQTDFVNSLKNM